MTETNTIQKLMREIPGFRMALLSTLPSTMLRRTMRSRTTPKSLRQLAYGLLVERRTTPAKSSKG